MVPTCPPSSIFHAILTLRTLIFAIPYSVFHCFFNILTNRFETASQASKSPPNYRKMAPKWFQDPPKMPPRDPKSGPRGPKSAPRASQDRQNDSLWAFPASHKTPKTTQETPKSSQEAPKRPPRAPKRLPRGSQEAPKRPPRGQFFFFNLKSYTLFIIGFDLAKSRNQRLDCQRHYFALEILAITIKCQNPLKTNIARGLPALKNAF